MQTIAPDFYHPFTGNSSAQAEKRPGDGFFDSLLREEEARYRDDLMPPRENSEAARPARDEPVREDPHREDAPREPRAERQDHPADDYAASRDADPSRDDKPRSDGQDNRPATARRDDEATEASAGTSGVVGDERAASQSTLPLGSTDLATDGRPQTGVAPGLAVAALAADPATTGTAKAATLAAGASKTNTTAAPPQQTADLASATDGAAARPISATASAQSAASTAAASKAAATATAKQPDEAAAINRGTPTPIAGAARTNGSSGGARSNGVGTEQAVVVQTVDRLSSRPSAALGGGSATAAMARSAEPAGNAQPKGNLKKAEHSLLGSAQNASAQAGQQGKRPEPGLATTADKAIQTSSILGTLGGSASGESAGSGSVHTGTAQHSSFAEAMANTRNMPTANPAEQIAVQVRRAQVAGQDQINIKLHPAELGRIEVRLESGADGTLRAVIAAERAETLDLLQRDARGLERALQDAGVKTDSGSLNFSLRGQGQHQERQADGNSGSAGGGADDATGDGEQIEIAAEEAQHYRANEGGALDIRV